MKKFKEVTIIGDGGWGTTLALLLSKKGLKVKLWGVFPEYIEKMRRERENVKFLPGVKISQDVDLTSDIAYAVSGAEVIVLAVPSQHMREVVERIKVCDLDKKPFVSVSKGIETGTLMRMSEVVTDILGSGQIGVLSGPTISYEVARGLPTTVVAASLDEEFAKEIQDLFISDTLRVYTNSDIIGVELGGSLKNVIAIAAGICDGLSFGVNTKAGLLVRGMVEIARLGVKMGAKQETFYGVSGLGDLVTTCVSLHGRNRWFGEEVGKGRSPEEILKTTEMAIEGVGTAKSCHELCKRFSVELPISQQIYSIIYENKDPKTAVRELMTRERKSES